MKKISLLLFSLSFAQAAFASDYKCTPKNDDFALGVLELSIVPNGSVIELSDGNQTCKFDRNSFVVLDTGIYRYRSDANCPVSAIDLLPSFVLGKFKVKSGKPAGYMEVYGKALKSFYSCEVVGKRAPMDSDAPDANSGPGHYEN